MYLLWRFVSPNTRPFYDWIIFLFDRCKLLTYPSYKYQINDWQIFSLYELSFSFWLLSYKAEIFWIFDQVLLTYSYFCCLWSHCYDHEILLLFSFRQWGSYRSYVYVYDLFWVHLCIKCSNSFLWMDIQLSPTIIYCKEHPFYIEQSWQHCQKSISPEFKILV